MSPIKLIAGAKYAISHISPFGRSLDFRGTAELVSETPAYAYKDENSGEVKNVFTFKVGNEDFKFIEEEIIAQVSQQ